MADNIEKRLERYRKTVEAITKANADGMDTSPEATEARKKRALTDYNFFARTYFPHLARSDSADFHIEIANVIKKHKRLRAVLELFRGAAKTSTLRIVLLWLVANGEKLYVLLTNATYDGAEGLLADLQAEFENNKLFIHDFGEQHNHGEWSAGFFVTQSGNVFEAIGRGQKPRGKLYFGRRPNVILCDDMDDDEMVLNERLVRKSFRWMTRALLMTMAMGEGRFIVANSRIHDKGLLAMSVDWLKALIKSSKDLAVRKSFYYYIKVNALDADGESTWPQAYPTAQVREMIHELGYAGSQQELFNNPIVEGTVFKAKWIQWKKPMPMRKYEQIVVYCDPSWKDTGDYKAIRMWARVSAKEYHLLWAFVRQCSIATMVKAYYDLHEMLSAKGVVAEYWIEASLNQDAHLADFEEEGEVRGYQLMIRPDKAPKADKFVRVFSTQPLYERGYIHYNEHMKGNPDFETGLQQLYAFERGSNAHDDAPDADHGALVKLYAFKPKGSRGLKHSFGTNQQSSNSF